MADCFCFYGDESGVPACRYQSIAVISAPKKTAIKLRGLLDCILRANDVTELKFNEIGTHSPKVRAASEFLDCFIVDYLKNSLVRVDVLCWDMHDKRHAVTGRDDIANLQRMWYKILVSAARQWNYPVWNFYPDENSAVNWDEIVEVINRTHITRTELVLKKLFATEDDERFFQIDETKALKSHDEPLIQLADIFAGMVRFSREDGEQCVHWLDAQPPVDQISFLDCIEGAIAAETKARQNRFRIIGNFNNICKKYRMGVSLRTNKYLCTFNNKRPINFWHYESVHEEDRAPVKLI